MAQPLRDPLNACRHEERLRTLQADIDERCLGWPACLHHTVPDQFMPDEIDEFNLVRGGGAAAETATEGKLPPVASQRDSSATDGNPGIPGRRRGIG